MLEEIEASNVTDVTVTSDVNEGFNYENDMIWFSVWFLKDVLQNLLALSHLLLFCSILFVEGSDF